MKQPQNTWVASLLIFILWLTIVVGGERLATGGNTTALDTMVQSQIVPALVIAPVFLLVLVALYRWWAPTGFTRFAGGRSLLLLWLPLLGIAFLLTTGLVNNSLSGKVLLFVLINTLLVGVSEELMLRGIVLYGASTRYGLWSAIWISAVLFGLMHTVNGFLTGEFGQAAVQAVFAFGSGLMFLGLRLRMLHIVPAMLIHGLWDFAIFINTSALIGVISLVFPILFMLYGIWLIRAYRHDHQRLPASTTTLLPPDPAEQPN